LAVGAAAIALSLVIGRRSLSVGGRSSRLIAVGVRALLVALLAAALAEPSTRDESEKLAVTAVLDMSRSVPAAAQVRAAGYVQAAAAAGRREDLDLLGSVIATRDAYVQSLPSPRAAEVEPETVGSPDGTNLEQAVRMALAIRPADAAYRLLLISDGNETEGSLLAAAEAARAAGVPVDVLPLAFRYDAEVIVEGIETPSSARMGDIINARITLRATAPTRGRLVILAAGEPIELGGAGERGVEVELDAGSNTLLVPLAIARRGPQQIEAVFEPIEGAGDDAIAENNRASSVTFFADEGRVLLLGASGEETRFIADALTESRIGVDILAPEAGPASLVDFNAYDGVIICNLPAYAFSEQQLDALKAYVEDSGGGLVMTGGPDSFGAGGWIGTPVEEILPVQLDPPQTRRMPRGALALIMHSVEMPEGVFYGQKTAEAAADALSRLDLVGIVEFSWNAGGVKWVHPLSPKGDGLAVRQAIKNLTFGDMPDMAPSVELAYQSLAKAEAGQKHAIIISDGDPSPPGKALLQKFVDAGITISTVGVFPHSGGPGSADLLNMKNIAEFTGGTYYGVTQSRQLATLPQIFIKEAQTVKRSLIWEGQPFAPALTGVPSPPMRGLSAVPELTGYVVTTDRQDGLAAVTIRGPENDPILAQWQRGLGRAVAFTGDATSRWAGAWTSWDGFRSFWTEHVRWAMRPTSNGQARTRIQTDGQTSTVIVDLIDGQGDRIDFAAVAGRVAGPTGDAEQIVLRQIGPGQYAGSFRTTDPGSYVVGLRYSAPGRDGGPDIEGSVQAAATRAFTDEFRAIEDNTGLLRLVAERTGGRVLSLDPPGATLWERADLEQPVAREAVVLVAIAVVIVALLIDVAVRRVRVDIAALRTLAARAMGRAAVVEGQSLESLRRARDRARGGPQAKPDADQARRSAKAAAARKFEAQPGSAPATIDLDATTKPAAIKDARATPQQPTPQDTEQGMSRLLRAKKRAQDEMTDD
jgi:uncharacterized membrane protein